MYSMNLMKQSDQDLFFFDKWHRIFYIPSRTDMAGHTKAFDYPVMDHWGKDKVLRHEADSSRQTDKVKAAELIPLRDSPFRGLCFCSDQYYQFNYLVH